MWWACCVYMCLFACVFMYLHMEAILSVPILISGQDKHRCLAHNATQLCSFLNALRKQLNWAAPGLSDWLQRLLVPSRACWNTRVKWPGSRTILFSWDCVELYWVLIQVPAGFCGRRRLAGRYSDDKDKEQLLMLSSATRLICRDSVLKK